ncbi:LemA family protein [Mycobacterium sp. M1]|uniref:LemA family protein n=1 Tax=Mycolicibacter acidiphilus TaxID=2835306 RepID=A0ABS5RFF8_9MYCO|nr:LemA family protein [Mycolicibacter acidiphilus]MBS9533026.1 LemA family protein [Mycolicibacter acidiphilus]
MSISVIVVIAVLALVVFSVLGVYNGLVRARNGYKNAFAQIDVQLTRRHDLIPNLVETAKAYLAHERGTLEAIVAARNTAVTAQAAASANPGDPEAMGKLASSEQALSGALGRLFALSEAYPDLKASQNMMQLSEELTSTENRVAFARQAYNDAVLAYNNKREVFPANMIAGTFGFTAAAPLEAGPETREVPRVQF